MFFFYVLQQYINYFMCLLYMCWRIEANALISDTTYNHGCTVPHGNLFISLTGPLFEFVDEPPSLTNGFCVFSLCVCGMPIMRQTRYVSYECLFDQGYLRLPWFLRWLVQSSMCVGMFLCMFERVFFTPEFHSEFWGLRGCRHPGIQHFGSRWSYKSRELTVTVRRVLEG